MSHRRDRIIAELELNLEEITRLFRSFSAKELATRVYTEEVSWTVQQVLAHFITIEKSMHWLFRNMLAGGPGSPKDFDFDRFNRTQPAKLDGFTLEELCTQFTTVRQETVAIVREMTDADLERQGWHVFHGKGKLERFVIWAYEHARLHMDDLHKVLAS